MKKYLLVLCFLTMSLFIPVLAEEEIYEQAITLDEKPTDAEIKATIDKFNFNDKQKEHLIKETKKRIDDIYERQKQQEAQNGSDCDPLPVIEPNKEGISNIEGLNINNKPTEK